MDFNIHVTTKRLIIAIVVLIVFLLVLGQVVYWSYELTGNTP